MCWTVIVREGERENVACHCLKVSTFYSLLMGDQYPLMTTFNNLAQVCCSIVHMFLSNAFKLGCNKPPWTPLYRAYHLSYAELAAFWPTKGLA